MVKNDNKSSEMVEDILQNLLREEFGKRTIENMSLPDYFPTSLNPMMHLRPYQEECFKYFITYWENSFDGKEVNPHLLFHMATGSGKTLIMAGLMLYLYEKGYRNFLFFVGSANIIEKTKDNFLNIASKKYLFSQQININNKQVEIRLVDNFQSCDKDCINLCLTTTQRLHTSLNDPKENTITWDDFTKYNLVMISDEAHHTNSATKKGKKVIEEGSVFTNDDSDSSKYWETTVMRIFHSCNDSSLPNVLLEFTATEDFADENIAEKYKNKVIFDYSLKKFREDKYSKDIEVVQSDLSPIDRALQCVLLSQYKRKLFESIHQDIKPVMMLKSKTKKENKIFFEQFADKIRHLTIGDLQIIKSNAKDDILDIFTYFDEQHITLDNLLLEIKEDFKEDNLLLIDGDNISADKQQQLNNLEAKDNGFRVIFAVDMLNEGWDVLNLFDIVRLYETRDAKDNKPGKTTMQEAQLIGRGARYMPFQVCRQNKNELIKEELPIDKRKFDNDNSNRLRMLETLHYHSANNSKYISELHTALVQTGIIADNTKTINLRLKDKFRNSNLYKNGLVFINEREEYQLNENVHSLGSDILEKEYKVRIRSGEMTTSFIFENTDKLSTLFSTPYTSMKLIALGGNIVRAAINRIEAYQFCNLKNTFPNLSSIKEFIENKDYLGGINIAIYGKTEIISNLPQKEKLNVAIEVLNQIKPSLLAKGSIGYKGSKLFTPKQIKDIFKDHIIKISIEGTDDKELGKSMIESTNPSLQINLSILDWHAYNDCFGTSEEKNLVKYIESIYPKLKEKYTDIYLLRNEKDIRLYSFNEGNAFEPDYVLFLKKGNESKRYDNIQIFIEPKGEHLRLKDKWKEDFLKEIKEKANIHFSTQGSNFNIWGMPFFTENQKNIFNKSIEKELQL